MKYEERREDPFSSWGKIERKNFVSAGPDSTQKPLTHW